MVFESALSRGRAGRQPNGVQIKLFLPVRALEDGDLPIAPAERPGE